VNHVVDAVHFDHFKPSSTAPITCICAWSGTVADWEQHRRDASRRRAKKATPQGGRPGQPFRLWVRPKGAQ
jgi:hypothetical protein